MGEIRFLPAVADVAYTRSHETFRGCNSFQVLTALIIFACEVGLFYDFLKLSISLSYDGVLSRQSQEVFRWTLR